MASTRSRRGLTKALSLLEREVSVQAGRLRRGGRPAVAWALRLTVAAVASYAVGTVLFPRTQPLLAPLTALLVVQVTPVSLLASGVERVLSVVAGVSLAVAFSAVVPLTWWSLGLLIAISIMIGQAMRLTSNLIEVPISAMLVLGVGSLGAEAAGGQRITETLVGAGVGVLSNLLFPPKVATEDAGNAIKSFADELAGLLNRAADEMAGLDGFAAEPGPRASAWLDEARRVTHDVPHVGAALLRAEQGRRLNVRALGKPDAGPGLRQGLEALEHSAVALRSMFRSVNDAMNDPGWPEGEVAEAVLIGLEQVFRDLAASVTAFGELVRAEARPPSLAGERDVDRLKRELDDLHEARARLSDLMLVDTSPVLFELHVALLATVKRLLSEMDPGERWRRQMRLQRPTPELMARAARLRRRR